LRIARYASRAGLLLAEERRDLAADVQAVGKVLKRYRGNVTEQ
jgi:hypothetical protein